MDATTMFELLSGLNRTQPGNSASKINPAGMFGILNALNNKNQSENQNQKFDTSNMFGILNALNNKNQSENQNQKFDTAELFGILNGLNKTKNNQSDAEKKQDAAFGYENAENKKSQNDGAKKGAAMKNNEYESYHTANGRTAYRVPTRANANANANGYAEKNQNGYSDAAKNRGRERPAAPQDPPQYTEEKNQNDEKNRAETSAPYSDLQYVNTAPKYKSTRKKNNIRYTGKG
ncbi:MAG: hypothetical protein LBP62_06470 [Clostridiales bacterium]|jgi:hypothetical protein|nr:hypothetical protein [Clostridiales bacterium]